MAIQATQAWACKCDGCGREEKHASNHPAGWGTWEFAVAPDGSGGKYALCPKCSEPIAKLVAYNGA